MEMENLKQESEIILESNEVKIDENTAEPQKKEEQNPSSIEPINEQESEIKSTEKIEQPQESQPEEKEVEQKLEIKEETQEKTTIEPEVKEHLQEEEQKTEKEEVAPNLEPSAEEHQEKENEIKQEDKQEEEVKKELIQTENFDQIPPKAEETKKQQNISDAEKDTPINEASNTETLQKEEPGLETKLEVEPGKEELLNENSAEKILDDNELKNIEDNINLESPVKNPETEEKVQENPNELIKESEEQKASNLIDITDPRKSHDEAVQTNKNEKEVNLLAKLPIGVVDIIKKSVEEKKEKPIVKKRADQLAFTEEDLQNIEKKKTRFQEIRAWDDNRGILLNSLICFTDTLFLNIDERIRTSEIYQNLVIQYFKEKIKIELDFSKMKCSSFKHSIKERKLSYYTDFEEILKNLDGCQEQKNIKITEFCQNIQKTILNEILKTEKEGFERDVSLLKKLIFTNKKKLNESNLKTSSQASIFFKGFKEMIHEKLEYNTKNDFFLKEIEFLNTTFSQMDDIKNLIIEMVKFILDFIELEKKRLESYKKSFDFYLKEYELVHGLSCYEEIKEAIESLHFAGLEKNNSIETYFTHEKLTSIFGKDFDNLKDFYDFLQKDFNFLKIPENNPLITYKKEIKFKKTTGRNYEDADALLTLDKNLVIFNKFIENEKQIPENAFNITKIKITEFNENTLEISEKIYGFLFNKEQNYRMQFDTPELCVEFKTMIGKTKKPTN